MHGEENLLPTVGPLSVGRLVQPTFRSILKIEGWDTLYVTLLGDKNWIR